MLQLLLIHHKFDPHQRRAVRECSQRVPSIACSQYQRGHNIYRTSAYLASYAATHSIYTMKLLRIKLVLATTIAIAQLAVLPHTLAYITSPHVLPVGRQLKWLKELTTDLVRAEPGALSVQQIAASHDLMYAWSHTAVHTKECALQVESLLKRVIEERRAGNVQADLQTADYNCLLEGWARSGLGEASALRTEQILEAMQEQAATAAQPNLDSFKACLMAWRFSGVKYAAVRAHRILNWMIRLYETGDNVHALPDADCFDIVLQLWSRSGNEQAPQQTERLLGVMEKLHRSTAVGNTNTDSKVKPRRSSFNAVLAAWSKSGSAAAPDRVTNIISFMELLAVTTADPSVAPDSASYNIVMNTYARSAATNPVTAAVQADAFVRHVIEVYRQQHANNKTEQQLKVDIILFNTAMGLWAKTGQSGSYRKARSILDRQIALAQECGTVMPDVVGWTSVLSSCAAETGNAEERNKAFQVAVSTYRQMEKLGSSSSSSAEQHKANHVTYGTMLKACAKLHPIKSLTRRKWVRTIFADAVAAGAVGDMVVSKLREAATPDLYKELMQGHSRKSLPAEWTANVHEQSEYRNKKKGGGGKKRAEV
jgi:hypothetical protein